MALINKYEKACSVCGVPVAIGAGYVKRDGQGPWLTYCKPCSGVVADERPAISVTLQGAHVAFKPATHLGGELFAKYRAMLDGAKYNRDEKCNLVPIAMAAKIVQSLHNASFVVNLDDAAKEAIENHGKAIVSVMAATDNRLTTIEATLAARGQALFAYQRVGIPWLAARDRALLADDQGLGKTLSTLLSLPAGAPMLVICPAVAKGVWLREAAKWRPEINVTVLEGEGSYRLPVPGEMVVINYDLLPEVPTMELREIANVHITQRSKAQPFGVVAVQARANDVFYVTATEMDIGLVCELHLADGSVVDLRAATVEKPVRITNDTAGEVLLSWRTTGPQDLSVMHHRNVDAPRGLCVVADEAHYVKGGKKTQRGQRMNVLCRLASSVGGKQLALTGTPLLNRPVELYKLLECFELATEAFGDWWTFTACFNGYQDRWNGWHFGDPTEEVGERLARVMLRRIKADVMKDMPAKRWETLDVDLDEGTRALCDEVDVVDVLKAIEAGRTPKFRTISKAREALAKAKTATMLEIAKAHEESETPLLVFSAHTYPIKQLGKRKGWAIITGETTAEERSAIENDFQAGNLLGVGLTIDAGGVAVTLTRASHVLFVDRDWTPALNAQAEDRAHRIGQKNAVLITTLVADHALDKRVAELLAQKQGMINASIEMARTTSAPAVEVASVDFGAITAQAAEEAAKRQAAEELAKARAAEAAIKAAEQGISGSCGTGASIGGKGGKGSKNSIGKVTARKLSEMAGEARAAASPQEEWAQAALITLTGLDPDGAKERNDIGFNKPDSWLGRALAMKVRGGLADAEWRMAVKMCKKYHGQVGECPAP